MNNEPVAWARQDGVIAFHKKPEVDSQGFKWFPLYTHPVKEQDESFDRTASHMAGKYVSYKKELSDEEIKSEAKYFCNSWHSQNPERLVLFAKAILKKAQEKTIQSVMSENCTCYKLGYSQLNDYASVKAK